MAASGVAVENAGGPLGASIGHNMFSYGFGVGSFVIIYYFFAFYFIFDIILQLFFSLCYTHKKYIKEGSVTMPLLQPQTETVTLEQYETLPEIQGQRYLMA